MNSSSFYIISKIIVLVIFNREEVSFVYVIFIRHFNLFFNGQLCNGRMSLKTSENTVDRNFQLKCAVDNLLPDGDCCKSRTLTV